MPTHILKFEHEGERYSLSLGYDAEGSGPDVARLDLLASRNEEVVAKADLRLDQEGVVEINVNDERVTSFHLIDFPDREEILIQILDQIPPMDPVIGCLIKGGLLAILKQLLACRRLTDSGQAWPLRLRAIARCLYDNIVDIGMDAAFRAARCILRGGLF